MFKSDTLKLESKYAELWSAIRTIIVPFAVHGLTPPNYYQLDRKIRLIISKRHLIKKSSEIKQILEVINSQLKQMEELENLEQTKAELKNEIEASKLLPNRLQAQANDKLVTSTKMMKIGHVIARKAMIVSAVQHDQKRKKSKVIQKTSSEVSFTKFPNIIEKNRRRKQIPQVAIHNEGKSGNIIINSSMPVHTPKKQHCISNERGKLGFSETEMQRIMGEIPSAQTSIQNASPPHYTKNYESPSPPKLDLYSIVRVAQAKYLHVNSRSVLDGLKNVSIKNDVKNKVTVENEELPVIDERTCVGEEKREIISSRNSNANDKKSSIFLQSLYASGKNPTCAYAKYANAKEGFYRDIETSSEESFDGYQSILPHKNKEEGTQQLRRDSAISTWNVSMGGIREKVHSQKQANINTKPTLRRSTVQRMDEWSQKQRRHFIKNITNTKKVQERKLWLIKMKISYLSLLQTKQPQKQEKEQTYHKEEKQVLNPTQNMELRMEAMMLKRSQAISRRTFSYFHRRSPQFYKNKIHFDNN